MVILRFLKIQRKQAFYYCMISIFMLISFIAIADLKLPAIIGDNMVIQRGVASSIWGAAEPGEKIAITFAGQKLETIADNKGKWMANLKPSEAGGPYEMIITGKNIITLRNILVGEVWVCSGQSNMQWSVNATVNAETEISQANYPMIRLFSVKRVVSGEPLKDTEGKWDACSSDTVKNFTAVGYYFGRDLHKTLNIPVGLIHTSWGGTAAEAWTSMPTMKSDPEFRPILDRWEQIFENYPKAKEQYEKQLAQWEQEAQKAKADGKPEPTKPRAPADPDSNPNRPSGLYNGMITPIIPFTIKGAIWYQGESNASRAYQYRKLFTSMIQDWRQNWGQGDFPFIFVQLANFVASQPPPVDSAWAELREAQLMSLSLPKTGMAVTIDIGEANDIHPKNKQDVGHRLALAAAAVAYDQDVTYSGPIYESMIIEKDKIRLFFKYTNVGLVIKSGDNLKGFAIAGRDQRFSWARSKIEGNTVVVWNEKVLQPIAVRYGWGDNPDCNLYNSAGLPASPFRTDQWPGITVGEQ
jgi:sialate O-acetylesterase